LVSRSLQIPNSCVIILQLSKQIIKLNL
jgi:hypothetical protein